jgi:hypothetical protein
MTRSIAALLTLLLTACDFIYGVSRSGPVSRVPDMERLKARIRSYPEVDKVELKSNLGGRPLTLTGIKSPDQLEYLNYSGKDVWASILFSKDYKGRVTYSQSHMSINAPPSQSRINATWPVMLRVEHDLELHFGLQGLSSHAETFANGVTLPK